MIDNSLDRMQNNLQLLAELLERYQMELNTDKTEFMTKLEGNLWYHNKKLKKVEQYKYLGKIIQNNLQHDVHLEN